MDALASIEDVNRILDPPIDLVEEPDEVDRVEFLLEEASDLVRAHTGRDFLKQVPGAVSRVVARMVARGLSSGGGEVAGMTSENQSAGAFSRSRSFEAGSTDGGVWLSRQDKHKLRRWKGGAFTIKTW